MIRDDCGQINYGIVAQCNFRTQRLLASWSAGQNWVGLYKKAVVVVMWRLGRGRYKYPELEEVIRSCRCSVMMRMMMMMMMIMIFSTRSLKEWPPLINSHSFISNQKSRTVSRWLLTGLNLCERMWIIESVFTLLGSLLLTVTDWMTENHNHIGDEWLLCWVYKNSSIKENSMAFIYNYFLVK